MRGKRLLIGTSGWSYHDWLGRFYPDSLSSSQFLGYYAGRFDTVEVNTTFYHLPTPQVIRSWRDAVPPGFTFSVKASRWITHQKKLRDCVPALEHMLQVLGGLGDHLGPLLFQLPPRWHMDLPRLESFLRALPPGPAYAFEFRDPTWFTEPVYDALSAHGVGVCVYDLAGILSPMRVTADFVYVRLHGPHKPYCGSYEDEELDGWATVFDAWTRRGKQVWCYFDNDESAYAARNARRMCEILSGDVVPG